MNKVVKEENEGLKEVVKQQDNNNIDATKEKEQQVSLSTQAYKLFSEGKTPLEVSIALNLRESEATKFYKEYWNLKQLHTLNMVYEQIKDDIEPFLTLFKVAKAKGMGVQQVVDVLAIANNDLPAIEERFKSLRNDVRMLQSQKHTCKRNLYQLNNQITSTTKLLNSFRMSCERKRKEIENLYTEKARLEAIVIGFKSNNEEYLKIKQAAEESAKTVLTNGKILLQFATASVIESLRRNPELCNFVLNDISSNDTNTTSYGSNCPSLMSEQQQPFSYIDDDIYSALILEESEKLYNKFITKLTNNVLVAATAVRASLPPLLNQKDDRL